MAHVIPNVVFAVCAIIGAVLAAIPLPKQLVSLNWGICLMLAWTEVVCLVQFANAVRWNGNIENWAPGWCDFCGRFLSAVDVALPAAAVSMNRRLYMIVTLDPKRNQVVLNAIIDVTLGIVIPWASIALQYVVQQYRFYILENVGCLPGLATVPLTIPLVYLPPLLMGMISVTYVFFALWAIARMKGGHRGAPGINGLVEGWSRRLFALGIASTLYGLIPTALGLALAAVASPLMPWPGWKALHSTIDVIPAFTAQEWQSTTAQLVSIELRRWTTVTLAFVLFGFLGFTEDVKKMYGLPQARDRGGSSTNHMHTRNRTSSGAKSIRAEWSPRKNGVTRPSSVYRACGFRSLGKPRTQPSKPRTGFTLTKLSRLDSGSDTKPVLPICRLGDDAKTANSSIIGIAK